eukprot:CAMPEP_0203882900 /NCGR_PEP_ID=MMETSP0359-20131031/27049_1 /ASSEMBLY_ACC=CAM_ASM_000338 /TAXON_ID=268821 /ORGANISM="Scrippsiella Hangoei, Strain SHTV-5" /LENGTH=46 /DNA_ID= /DNA_START= /DNA_END= /DNA_ORIENTATION=
MHKSKGSTSAHPLANYETCYDTKPAFAAPSLGPHGGSTQCNLSGDL